MDAKQQAALEARRDVLEFLEQNGFQDISVERDTLPPEVPNFERIGFQRAKQLVRSNLFKKGGKLLYYDLVTNHVWTADTLKTGKPIHVRYLSPEWLDAQQAKLPHVKDVLASLSKN